MWGLREAGRCWVASSRRNVIILLKNAQAQAQAADGNSVNLAKVTNRATGGLSMSLAWWRENKAAKYSEAIICDRL